jgi:hypothetical protein
MPAVKYLFGDLATGDIICELPMTSVSMDLQLNQWSMLRGTMRFDSSGIDNQDIVDGTLPGRTTITVVREDTPIWSGIVWTRTYDSLGKDLNLSARTFDAYAERVFVGNFTRVAYEQRNIMVDLWNTMQTFTESNIGINIPSSFSTVVPRDLTVMASEYKNYYQNMTSIADGEDGFDWTITTTWENNEFVRTLRIGYPFLGTTSSAGLSFDYPGSILNYWKTDGMTSAATNLYVLGAGEGDAMLVGTSSLSELLQNGHKRFDLAISRKDISNQGQVNSLAAQLGMQRKPPLSTIKVMLKADIEPVFGSYGLGDTAILSIIDSRHPAGLQTSARIVAMSYRPQSDDSVEEVELIFDGDALNN